MEIPNPHRVRTVSVTTMKEWFRGFDMGCVPSNNVNQIPHGGKKGLYIYASYYTCKTRIAVR